MAVIEKGPLSGHGEEPFHIRNRLRDNYPHYTAVTSHSNGPCEKSTNIAILTGNINTDNTSEKDTAEYYRREREIDMAKAELKSAQQEWPTPLEAARTTEVAAPQKRRRNKK